MKQSNNSRLFTMALMVAVFAAISWSCDKDEDPSLGDLRQDKLAYLEDSLRISDSLRRINAAGIVNYSITVVNGSTSSFAGEGLDGGRGKRTQNIVDGAIVTISQFGKTETDTTDENGMVVFNGFFRSSVNVSVRREGFTSMNYVAAVSVPDSTTNGSISFVGNLIPIFETTGTNTATIKGKATIQTDLTNKTRELAPDGTTVLAAIDAESGDFEDKYLTSDLDVLVYFEDVCECMVLYAGAILHASYSSGTVGTVTNGDYTITVPAAIDGLPLKLTYSDVAEDQTLFEFTSNGDPFDRTNTYRNIFPGTGYMPTSINAAGGVVVSFNAGSGAAATPVLNMPGTIDKINVTSGGFGFNGTPLVEIVDNLGVGTGATATAEVTNGIVTGVNITAPGNGYMDASNIDVNFIYGSGAFAQIATLNEDGTVVGVQMIVTGSGYTTAPNVTFSPPTGSGTTAQGVANIQNGRVVSVNITNPGSGYTGNPTVTFDAAPAGGVTAVASGIYSGQSIASVIISDPGQDFTYVPTVTFPRPERPNGTRATGTVTINAASRTVVTFSVTNSGSGYLPSQIGDVISIEAGSGVAAEAELTGGSIISANVTSQGSQYTSAPLVSIVGDGVGATGAAILQDGKVIDVDIITPGTGYTFAEIEIIEPIAAQAFATVTNGVVTGVTVINGGASYTGAPAVTFAAAVGAGAAGTATVSGGQVTGVTVTNGGTGYVEGNTPAGAGQNFSATKGDALVTKPGLTFINDIYYGTGIRQPN